MFSDSFSLFFGPRTNITNKSHSQNYRYSITMCVGQCFWNGKDVKLKEQVVYIGSYNKCFTDLLSIGNYNKIHDATHSSMTNGMNNYASKYIGVKTVTAKTLEAEDLDWIHIDITCSFLISKMKIMIKTFASWISFPMLVLMIL